MKYILAPMADITNAAFREACYLCGADSCFTEMVSAKAIHFKNKKTVELTEIKETEPETVIQLFGAEPEIFGEAATIIEKMRSFHGFDINMGCPVRKVVKSGSGVLLMTDPPKARQIIRAVRNASAKQLSVKIRKGCVAENWEEMAMIAQDEGADMLTVHPRFRAEMFTGISDHTVSLRLAKKLKIKVVHSGDITAFEDMKKFEDSGLYGVMVGRGAMGKPWIFKELKENRELTLEEKKEIMAFHFRKIILYYKGSRRAMELKKNASWYSKGFQDCAKFRKEVFQNNSDSDGLVAYISNFFNMEIA